MKLIRTISSLFLIALTVPAFGQNNNSLNYNVEAAAMVSNGDNAPLWLTANRYGVTSSDDKFAYMRAGLNYNHEFNGDWSLNSGIELVGGKNVVSKFWIHQAYADISWKVLTLSLGSKERTGFPLDKNPLLTSGWLAEGTNMRPIPQIRGEIKEYYSLPFTGNWVAFKGHLCYGFFTDGKWQEDFAAAGQMFNRDVLYHSKSLMIRMGNKEKLPLEFEFGLLTCAQFGGDRFKKNADGSVSLVRDMPDGIKDYWKIFFPTQASTLENVQGNHCGSWNFGLNYYLNDWRFRAYLEHYFEDHSQMFWQYGRWKDGHIGLEVSFPENRWISSFVWEGLNTTDQTGPILYDGVGGSFNDLQMSGGDNYYNNGEYLGWQNYGASLGHPFLMGPQYNKDGSNEIKGSRVKAQHIGLMGEPAQEWKWRMLFSFSRNWGTYAKPFDEVAKQFNSMAEVTYLPKWAEGWSATAALAIDKGDYPGNSTGFMVSIKKVGELLK